MIRKLAAIEKSEKDVKLQAKNEDDIRGLMDAYFRNLHQAMYKTITNGKKCENCGNNKNLQRCHTVHSRKELEIQAIRDAPVDQNGFKSSKAILIHYLKLHLDEDVKIMCQPCHREYDELLEKVRTICKDHKKEYEWAFKTLLKI